MAVREYKGARYVPIFADQPWTNTITYEPLTVVLYQGNSYTSRQYVPVGIDIANEDFWAETGNYNAQVEAYRKEVAGVKEDIIVVQTGLETEIADRKEQFQSAMTYDYNNIVRTTAAEKVTDIPAVSGTYMQGSYVDEENKVIYAVCFSGSGAGTYVRKYSMTGEVLMTSANIPTLGHGNSVSLLNGELHIVTLNTRAIAVVDATTLTLKRTYNCLTSPAWLTFDVSNPSIMVTGEAGQIPNFNVYAAYGDGKQFSYMQNFTYDIGNWSYNQGGSAYYPYIYIPVYTINEGKSMVEVYTYNGSHIATLLMPASFGEIEDVTAYHGYFYATAGNGGVFKVMFPNTNSNVSNLSQCYDSEKSIVHGYSVSHLTYVKYADGTDTSITEKIELPKSLSLFDVKRNGNILQTVMQAQLAGIKQNVTCTWTEADGVVGFSFNYAFKNEETVHNMFYNLTYNLTTEGNAQYLVLNKALSTGTDVRIIGSDAPVYTTISGDEWNGQKSNLILNITVRPVMTYYPFLGVAGNLVNDGFIVTVAE